MPQDRHQGAMKFLTPLTILVLIGGGSAIVIHDYIQYGPDVAGITAIGFTVLVFAGFGIYTFASNGIRKLRSGANATQ